MTEREVYGQPWTASMIERGEHVTDADGWCWCQPTMKDVLPFGAITVHRHFWDRPEYGNDDDG